MGGRGGFNFSGPFEWGLLEREYDYLSEYDYFSGDQEKNYWKKTKEDMGKLQKSRRGL